MEGVQLLELGRIVLGIRLFNKEQKRGGAGLSSMDEEAYEMVAMLSGDIGTHTVHQIMKNNNALIP